MIITTTNTIEGRPIREYLGIVNGEVIIGINLIKDFAAGLTNIFGGRSGSYENELVGARARALDEIRERAAQMGADAVVGVDLDFEVLGQNGSMMMIVATGTAVKF
ncbi:MAG: YbjQ family protein [Proteocatella sp.]